MSIEHILRYIGRLWSDAMNNRTSFTKAPNEWKQIKHNMCGRRVAWSPLWWWPCTYTLLYFSVDGTLYQLTKCCLCSHSILYKEVKTDGRSTHSAVRISFIFSSPQLYTSFLPPFVCCAARTLARVCLPFLPVVVLFFTHFVVLYFICVFCCFVVFCGKITLIGFEVFVCLACHCYAAFGSFFQLLPWLWLFVVFRQAICSSSYSLFLVHCEAVTIWYQSFAFVTDSFLGRRCYSIDSMFWSLCPYVCCFVYCGQTVQDLPIGCIEVM